MGECYDLLVLKRTVLLSVCSRVISLFTPDTLHTVQQTSVFYGRIPEIRSLLSALLVYGACEGTFLEARVEFGHSACVLKCSCS